MVSAMPNTVQKIRFMFVLLSMWWRTRHRHAG
jgi:hypothetical protein